jgi:DNA-binding beta-propeller fold protein YncE
MSKEDEMRMRSRAVLALSIGALAITPSAALGDGLPIPGVQVKAGGVATPDGRTHFLPRSTGARTTVRRVDWSTGKATAATAVNGDYTVPAVALDGSPGGLSANGRWLTLIQPRRSFPQATTHLVVLGAESLKVRERLDLRGDFSFDAISPSGDRIYLIQYRSGNDPTRYAVRAYDLTIGRMLPKTVVDPTEPDEQMRGYPITRVASPDGRWQYTLYSGTKKPFVHALDTGRGTARCIDLPRLRGSIYSDDLRITPDGSTLSVSNRNKGTLASIDTGTFRVSTPGGESGDGAASAAGTGFPWILIGLGTGLVVAAAALLGVPWRHRRQLAGGS